MLELLQWLEAQSVKNLVAAQSANSLLFAYFVAYLFNRKAAFTVAFLCVEFYGNSFITDQLSSINFYMGYAAIYCLLYFYLHQKQEKKRTLAAVVLIILLDVGSALDAYAYPETETYFYQAYTYFYVFVHVVLLVSLINWRILSDIMGCFLNAFLGYFGISYRMPFFCYNLFTFNKNQIKP
jgi:hypothetical protein